MLVKEETISNDDLEGVGSSDVCKEINNGKSKKKKQECTNNPIVSEKEKEKNKILEIIQKLREEITDLSLEEWSNTLLEKRLLLNEKINEYFPTMTLLLDFELSVKTILNIQDITLPFMGIVFAVPSSLKTKFFRLLRKLWYSYYTDKFTARSFVSHSANVTKDKLHEIDMLPHIKDKILLTPELSALFSKKDDDVKEELGIITRVLDGEGLETNSGVHGKRGYYGNYMFTWLGAAVDIPYNIYKFMSIIGFKIYFLRLPRTEVTKDDLVEQLTSKKKFGEKIEEVEKLLLDYLSWFEICPIALGQSRNVKIEWDTDKDDRDAIRNIAELAILLAHIRGSVLVYRSSEHPEFVPFNNSLQTTTAEAETDGKLIKLCEKGDTHYYDSNKDTKQKSTAKIIYNYSEGFSHRLPIIESPSRAAQQLYNLARGHALSYGRNYITKEDVSLVIKVVLSTSLIERVLVLDLLIAYKGTLTTSQITKSMRLSNDAAKRTMTEFKGLELVTMEQTSNSSNSEFKITLDPKFKWFLSDEFKELRDEFKPIDYQEYLAKRKSAATKNTPVHHLPEQQQPNSEEREEQENKPTTTACT